MRMCLIYNAEIYKKEKKKFTILIVIKLYLLFCDLIQILGKKKRRKNMFNESNY